MWSQLIVSFFAGCGLALNYGIVAYRHCMAGGLCGNASR